MNQYFAALEASDLAKDLSGKIDKYYQWLLVSGRLARWRMSFDSYYGQRDSHNSSYITASGEQGELSFLMANEYRNLVQHLLVLTTQNRPSIECAAVNSDRASQEQAILGKQLLDYYRKEGGLDKAAKLAIEIALLMDTSWVITEWDIQKGTPLRPDFSGQLLTDGDITCRVRTPLDVVIDYSNDNGLEQDWQMVRDLVNKYDLAAQYPDKAEEIIGLNRDQTKDSTYRFGDQATYGFNTSDSPLIERYTFYHRKTPAMPQGRMFQFLDSKTWLFDGPLPYRRLPGRRCCPTEMVTSALGYSNTNDLLAIQDVLDALVSAAVTNMTSSGINNIWAKPNSNIDFEQLSSGMNYIESEEKPEVLVLNKLPPEWFNLANWLVSRMEAYSGVNSVARGNTEGKDLSGAAMALLQSMAIQFNSGLQQAYNQVVEDINNDALSHLQDFAKSERIALIAGESNKYAMERFTSESISKIQRVYCRQANSMQDTTAGKLVILKDLLSIPGVIKNADEYLQVLQTGSLLPAVEDESKALLVIKDENEQLAKGQYVPVVFTENHPRHIIGHQAVLSDPQSKQDPKLVSTVLQHMQEHINVWSTTDPNILTALGIPPIPVPMIPPQGAMPQQGGPAAELPPGNATNTIPSAPPEAGGPNPAPAAGPSLPKNPMTQKEWEPATGGL